MFKHVQENSGMAPIRLSCTKNWASIIFIQPKSTPLSEEGKKANCSLLQKNFLRLMPNFFLEHCGCWTCPDAATPYSKSVPERLKNYALQQWQRPTNGLPCDINKSLYLHQTWEWAIQTIFLHKFGNGLEKIKPTYLRCALRAYTSSRELQLYSLATPNGQKVTILLF